MCTTAVADMKRLRWSVFFPQSQTWPAVALVSGPSPPLPASSLTPGTDDRNRMWTYRVLQPMSKGMAWRRGKEWKRWEPSGACDLLRAACELLRSCDFCLVIFRTPLYAGCECSFFTDEDAEIRAVWGLPQGQLASPMAQNWRPGCPPLLPPVIHQKCCESGLL